MPAIVFELNNEVLRIERSEKEVKQLLYDLFGVEIKGNKEQESYKHTEQTETFEQKSTIKKHPSVDELIAFLERMPNYEFGTELIRKEFYSDLDKQEWRKAYSSLFAKIMDAMKRIEEKEKGHFIKHKEGKFTYYRFIKDNIPQLYEYESVKDERI